MTFPTIENVSLGYTPPSTPRRGCAATGRLKLTMPLAWSISTKAAGRGAVSCQHDMSKKKPSSPRAERRAREHALVKLARERERLAMLEDGGSPSRPIDVESASQVEPHARSMPCARCGHALRTGEHAAETIDGARLRIARMACSNCGARRAIYFRILQSN